MAINSEVSSKYKCFILAGGSGFKLWMHRKFHPLIQSPKYPFAKPAAIVGNRKAIDFSLEAAKKAGLNKVWINLHTNAESIRNYKAIDVFRNAGMEINWVDENRLFGTGGSVKNLAQVSGINSEESALILHGDVIHNVNLQPMIKGHCEKAQKSMKPGITIMVNPIQNWDMMVNFGSVRLNGMPKRGDFHDWAEFENETEKWFKEAMKTGQKFFDVIGYAEKLPRRRCLGNLGDSAIVIIDGDLIKDIIPKVSYYPSEGEIEVPGKYFYDMSRHVFPWILQNPEKYFFQAFLMPDESDGKKTYWLDVGSKQRLWQANMDILDGKIDSGLEDGVFWKMMTWGWQGKHDGKLDANAIAPDAMLKKCIISHGAIVKKGAYLEKCVVREGVVIEEGVRAKNCVFFPSSDPHSPNIIGANSCVENITFVGGVLDPYSEEKGTGGELLITPKTGMVKIPLETETYMSMDEKRTYLIDETTDREFAQLCIGGMPTKHFEDASIDRLMEQIQQLRALFEIYLLQMAGKKEEKDPVIRVVDGSTDVVPDSTEITVVSNEGMRLRAALDVFLGSKFTFNGKPFPLSIRADWSLTKNNASILIFEVVDETGKKLPDDVLNELIRNIKEFKKC